MYSCLKPTKYLYLMRHAKAEECFSKKDIERDLHPKGIKRIAKAIDYCQQQGVKADMVMLSAANRTKQTAAIMAEALAWEADKMHTLEGLYLCSAEYILNQLYALDDKVQHAWVIGHNPGISNAAYALNTKNSMWLPTAGIVGLSFKIKHWYQLANAKTKTIFTFLR